MIKEQVIQVNSEVNYYEDIQDPMSLIDCSLWVESVFLGEDGETYATCQGYEKPINVKQLLPLI